MILFYKYIFWEFSNFLKPETWHLRHWLHFWQLRTTIWTITLWHLNREWWWQHSQFLQCLKSTLNCLSCLHEILMNILTKSYCSISVKSKKWLSRTKRIRTQMLNIKGESYCYGLVLLIGVLHIGGFSCPCLENSDYSILR